MLFTDANVRPSMDVVDSSIANDANARLQSKPGSRAADAAHCGSAAVVATANIRCAVRRMLGVHTS